MGLFDRTVVCEGCGKEYRVAPGLGVGRIKRCSSCPEAPNLGDQLAELFETVERSVRKHAAYFAVRERMDSWGPGAHHVCELPKLDKDDPWARDWKCPDCGLLWRKAGFYGWQPT